MKYPFKIADEPIPVLKEYRNQPPSPEGTSLEDAFITTLKEMAEQVGIQSTKELKVESKAFENSEGIDIKLRVFTPRNGDSAMPCLYWMHDGGTVSGLPEQEDSTLYELALDIGCVIVSAGYRLVPESAASKDFNAVRTNALNRVFQK